LILATKISERTNQDGELGFFGGDISPLSFACLIEVSIKKAARLAVGLPWESAHCSSCSNTESGKVTKTLLLTVL
jgi:hypothetical protein